MARQTSSQPTEVELQMLKILWQDGPGIARHLHDSLQEFKETTYSTTVKMLSVMLDNGLFRRDDAVLPQIDYPSGPQPRTQRQMLGNLIENFDDGSAAQLMVRALSSKKAIPQEIAEIRPLLEAIEEKQ
ncbi:BlaI/MecI/CopY family transcriptional regulator [Roseiconus nitratireducens]|uniref:BlaI/MecI/CopY family transcriptional regulator n=1 Tax=Roseiconus nitratireducens TaxID=2605748 RepID=A0A5M6CUM4_9BACT|nr:BlaI/MecI/CopY family transcriptional regulator [Roseiconus nitratireducens]KAA5538656.1 BlaI/MecI/CopY family transcriptional regulator [Roseiconus nitratireducens]